MLTCPMLFLEGRVERRDFGKRGANAAAEAKQVRNTIARMVDWQKTID